MLFKREKRPLAKNNLKSNMSFRLSVKLPDEVCVSDMKCVGENKTVLQLKQFAEVLFTGLTFKKKC